MLAIATAAEPTMNEPGRLMADAAPRHWSLWMRAVLWCLVVDLLIGALVGGIAVRRWAWARTEPIRYTPDIDNAFRQGSGALRVGYLDYDDAVCRPADPDGGDTLGSDYAPGRLAVATLWAAWVRDRVDYGSGERPAAGWNHGFYETARLLGRQDELCAPLLRFNLAMELAAVAGAFALVRRWTLATRGATGATASGVAAGLLLWFNPALVWDAHCWPQWDAWLLPFYLWALVAASDERWFTAGCLVGVGAMFKAQILLAAPVLALWPLFQGRWRSLARHVSGLACGVAACVGPWLVRVGGHPSAAAVLWVAGVAATGGATLAARRWVPRTGRGRAAAGWPVAALAALAALAVAWPLPRVGWLLAAGVAVTTVLVVGAAWVHPRFGGRYAWAAAMALALFACVPVFGGSTAWLRAGVVAGTRQLTHLRGKPFCNLPALLATGWGWDADDPVVTVPAGPAADAVGSALAAVDREYAHVPGRPAGVPVKWALAAGYAVAVVACGAATALQAARGSPLFLVAATAAPWTVTFALLPQLHERHLLWATALGATAAVLSPGLLLLDLFVAAVALMQDAFNMARGTDPALAANRLMAGLVPNLGWALLFAAAVYLYLAFSRGGQLPVERGHAGPTPARTAGPAEGP